MTSTISIMGPEVANKNEVTINSLHQPWVIPSSWGESLPPLRSKNFLWYLNESEFFPRGAQHNNACHTEGTGPFIDYLLNMHHVPKVLQRQKRSDTISAGKAEIGQSLKRQGFQSPWNQRTGPILYCAGLASFTQENLKRPGNKFSCGIGLEKNNDLVFKEHPFL